MRKRFLLGGLSVVGVLALVWRYSSVSLADSTGTVIVESAKIREEADVTSSVIGSSAQGTTVTIKDEATDDSGTVWYQVYVDGDTLGYIRSDLVEKADGDSADTTQTEDTADSQTTSASETSGTEDTGAATGGAEVQPDTAMDPQYAVISVQAAKIRTAPSTSNGVVATLAEGEQVVVSGKSDGSDGKEWYYVTFTGSDGSEKTGFVRYDLVSLGDLLPVEEETEEEPVEEQETEEVNHDFELKYEQDGDGYAWYLYDNRDSESASRQKLEQLLEAAEQAMADTTPADTDTVVKQRIVIVVLVVLAVALAIAVIIMAFKLRDAYYEDYEDEEEEAEEPEEEPIKPAAVRKRAGAAEREAEEPAEKAERATRRKAGREEALTRQRPQEKTVMQEVTYEEEPDVKVPVKTAPKRKAKNFLIDDDDFEFEFLNMDDKDF